MALRSLRVIIFDSFGYLGRLYTWLAQLLTDEVAQFSAEGKLTEVFFTRQDNLGKRRLDFDLTVAILETPSVNPSAASI